MESADPTKPRRARSVARLIPRRADRRARCGAGHTSSAGVKSLRDIARAIRRRDRVDAVVLAGTDLNLIFDEASAGFPAFDCASAHIEAILDRATPRRPTTDRGLAAR
jgi:hypothetical protein